MDNFFDNSDTDSDDNEKVPKGISKNPFFNQDQDQYSNEETEEGAVGPSDDSEIEIPCSNDDCIYKTKIKSNMRRHLRKVHKVSNPNEYVDSFPNPKLGKDQCQFCQKLIVSQKLKRHANTCPKNPENADKNTAKEHAKSYKKQMAQEDPMENFTEPDRQFIIAYAEFMKGEHSKLSNKTVSIYRGLFIRFAQQVMATDNEFSIHNSFGNITSVQDIDNMPSIEEFVETLPSNATKKQAVQMFIKLFDFMRYLVWKSFGGHDNPVMERLNNRSDEIIHYKKQIGIALPKFVTKLTMALLSPRSSNENRDSSRDSTPERNSPKGASHSVSPKHALSKETSHSLGSPQTLSVSKNQQEEEDVPTPRKVTSTPSTIESVKKNLFSLFSKSEKQSADNVTGKKSIQSGRHFIPPQDREILIRVANQLMPKKKSLTNDDILSLCNQSEEFKAMYKRVTETVQVIDIKMTLRESFRAYKNKEMKRKSAALFSSTKTPENEVDSNAEDDETDFFKKDTYQLKRKSIDTFIEKISLQPDDAKLKTVEAISLRTKDFYRILSCDGKNSWLEDTTIDAYLKLIQARNANQPDEFVNVLAFPGSFLEILRAKQDVSSAANDEDLYNYDVIFFPTCGSNRDHWFLYVFYKSTFQIHAYDSLGEARYHQKYFPLLTNYVTQEMKRNGYETPEIGCYYAESPKQSNLNDCGIFLLMCADAISQEKYDFNFSQKNIPVLRKVIAYELYKKTLFPL